MRPLKLLMVLAAATALAHTAAPAMAREAPQRHMFIVFGDSQPGQDDAFGAWYDKHFTEILKLPGFVSAQRFVDHPVAGRDVSPHKYFIVFEIEGDPTSVLAAIAPAVGDGRITRSDPKVVKLPFVSYVFTPQTPKVMAPKR